MTQSQQDSSGDLERLNHELSVLNDIARELNRSVGLGDALGFTLSRVAELLGLGTGWIWLLSDSSSDPYLAATLNLPPALSEDPARMDGSSYCYCLDTYKKGDLEGAANVNVVSCSRLKDLVDGTGGLRYHASVPLYAGEKKLGVMNVASPAWRGLSSEDLKLLYTVGDLLSIAVERARLFDKSTRMGAAEERNRLARELHDTLAQGLAAATLQLEAADAILETGPHPANAREYLHRALSITQGNLEDARRSVLDLRAAPLEGRTLSEALAILVERRGAESTVPTSYESVNGSHPMPPNVEAALYRVCEEALNNFVRHAEARSVNVRLVVTADLARLIVQDDGRGFDPTSVSSDRHGLAGMRERMMLLGGTLKVDSDAVLGTRITAVTPLEDS
ncbi:MAG: histidine kinase [Rubrobacteraceae bacterium]